MVSIKEVKILEFNDFKDKEGHLVPLEQNGEVPFSIKRVYYVFGVSTRNPRGEHSHFITDQLLICLKGKCEVRCNDGYNEKNFVLDSPSQGLYIPAMIWGEQVYNKDTILLVLASTHYDKADYIENWNDFVKEVDK